MKAVRALAVSSSFSWSRSPAASHPQPSDSVAAAPAPSRSHRFVARRDGTAQVLQSAVRLGDEDDWAAGGVISAGPHTLVIPPGRCSLRLRSR